MKQGGFLNNSITILQFSTRENGNCKRISSYLQDRFRNQNICSYIIGKDNFKPCGNCDYQCLKPNEHCTQLTSDERTILDQICQSRLVYFIIPNYCGYPCAHYFAFNERTVGYFNRNHELLNQYLSIPKRFIIVSNTEGFEEVVQQQTNEEPRILYLKSRKYHKRSIDGDILDSVDATADLDAFLASDFL